MAFSNQDSITNVRWNLQNSFDKLNKAVQNFLPKYAPPPKFVGGLAEQAIIGAKQAAKSFLTPQVPKAQPSRTQSMQIPVQQKTRVDLRTKIAQPSATIKPPMELPSFEMPKRYSVPIPDFKIVGGKVVETYNNLQNQVKEFTRSRGDKYSGISFANLGESGLNIGKDVLYGSPEENTLIAKNRETLKSKFGDKAAYVDSAYLGEKFLKDQGIDLSNLSPEERDTFNRASKIQEGRMFGAVMGATQPIKNVAKESLTQAGKVVSQSNVITKLVNLIREAKVMRPDQESLYSAERALRSAKVASLGKKIGGEKGFQAQLGALKGELPKMQFERIRHNFAQPEIDGLFNQVEDFGEFLPFEKVTTKNALAKLLDKRGGGIPTEGEIKLLSKVFPDDLIQAIKSKEPMTEKLLQGIGEILNVPRAIMSSFDLSAPLRQGIFLIGRPKQWGPAFKDMFKYAFSEEAYDNLFFQIAKRETYPLMRQHNLALTDLRNSALNVREEAFMSNLPEKIPLLGGGIRASNRAYTGFLNKLRADVFDDLIRSSKEAGVPQDARLYDAIARFVNAATGRGKLPDAFEQAAPLLNATFFSPRLMASRLNLLNPKFYTSLHPTIRKEALKSLLSFASAGTAVLTLSKLAGAEVGTDPRSADFGKVKVGNTRYDIWGGFQQYIKLASQLISGQVVSSTSGRLMTLGEGYKPLTRKDIILRFFESKEAPVASFVTTLLQQQTPTGKQVDAKSEAIERFIPMAIGDMVELWQEGGLNMLGWLPAVFGVGSQSYGKQELVKGENLIGEPTIESRPIQGLGERIVEKVFGPQPLQSSRTFSVEKYVEQLDEMPKEQAGKIWSEIRQVNPDLAKKIRDVKKGQALGITVEDKVLKEKGVASGERALEIFEEFNKLGSDQERAKLWSEYRKKGIITDEVSQQLRRLINRHKNNP